MTPVPPTPMRSLDISTRLLSELLWTRIIEHSAARHLDGGPALFAALGQLDRLRAQAQYNTGSISTAAQWTLYSLCYLWRPAVVAEIGTFIGKSTIAMARGMDAAGSVGEVHTCDMSNSFVLPTLSETRVIQYPGTSSTQMLTELVEDGYAGRVELFHVDGRLQPDDIGLMTQLAAPDAIVALDDFEGMEKGVANLFNLRKSGAFSKHLTVYPPDERVLRQCGFWDRGSTGLLVPQSQIRFTAQ